MLASGWLNLNSQASVCTVQLGEGGYAFVYLAKPLKNSGRGQFTGDPVAIKKVCVTLKATIRPVLPGAQQLLVIRVAMALGSSSC